MWMENFYKILYVQIQLFYIVTGNEFDLVRINNILFDMICQGLHTKIVICDILGFAAIDTLLKILMI